MDRMTDPDAGPVVPARLVSQMTNEEIAAAFVEHDEALVARIIAHHRDRANQAAVFQIDALMGAGWSLELPRGDLDAWAWAWRSPPKRKNSKGKRWASTQQAFNAYMRGLGLDPYTDVPPKLGIRPAP
jgi:hypothetical protein